MFFSSNLKYINKLYDNNLLIIVKIQKFNTHKIPKDKFLEIPEISGI